MLTFIITSPLLAILLISSSLLTTYLPTSTYKILPFGRASAQRSLHLQRNLYSIKLIRYLIVSHISYRVLHLWKNIIDNYILYRCRKKMATKLLIFQITQKTVIGCQQECNQQHYSWGSARSPVWRQIISGKEPLLETISKRRQINFNLPPFTAASMAWAKHAPIVACLDERKNKVEEIEC